MTNWYPTAEAPTRAVWVREHAKAVRLYDDVVVLHCVGPDSTLTTRWTMALETDGTLTEGIPTYRLRYRPCPIPMTSYAAYLWSALRAFRRLTAQGSRPDIIHVHVYDAGGPAILIGALSRIPVVVTEHFSSFSRGLLGRLDLLKAWLAFRWADRVLPVSRALQDAIERYGIRADFLVIPNVVDPALFAPPPGPPTPPTPTRFLFVGQLVPAKGIPCLLEALHRLRQKRDDWYLDIVGDGAARPEYEGVVARLALADRVAFHGLKSRQEVAEFMRRADVFVLPSLYETFSVPAVEALATGIPVLATRCGGPEEFLTDDVGVLVPPGDPRAFSEGLEYFLDDRHRYSRSQISQYAVQRFSPAVVGAQLHAVYESVRRRTRRSTPPADPGDRGRARSPGGGETLEA